ncbi:hypothetical protein Tco_0957853 [Tanacetum coccineum]
MIQSAINESLKNVILAKSSSQPKSTYKAAASLTEFELKKILLDNIQKSKSYQAAPEHKELYDALVKSYKLDKDLFDSYGLKKRKTSKDAEPTKGPKTKESKFSSSKGNMGNDDEEPMREVASKRDWFTKPKQPQEPTDPDWNVSKTPQQGPTQSWLMTLATTTDKPSKTFDELMSTPIDFFAYIMNDLNITNLTQETLLGPAFKLLKGTRTNFAELEYEFE